MPRSLFLSLSLLLATLHSCEPKEPLPELVEFAFLTPARITPGADTVARGDTLWLTLDFADSLLDLRSLRRVRAQPADLSLAAGIVFRRLIGAGQLGVGATAAFTCVVRGGQLSAGGSLTRVLEPLYDGRRYRARLGIVPREAGVFSVGLLSLVGPHQSLRFLQLPPAPDGRPRTAILDGIRYVVNDGNVHFNIQQQHSRVLTLRPDAHERDVYYEQKATFSFVVR